jgi:Glycosyl hydrolase catalytic core
MQQSLSNKSKKTYNSTSFQQNELMQSYLSNDVNNINNAIFSHNAANETSTLLDGGRRKRPKESNCISNCICYTSAVFEKDGKSGKSHPKQFLKTITICCSNFLLVIVSTGFLMYMRNKSGVSPIANNWTISANGTVQMDFNQHVEDGTKSLTTSLQTDSPSEQYSIGYNLNNSDKIASEHIDDTKEGEDKYKNDMLFNSDNLTTWSTKSQFLSDMATKNATKVETKCYTGFWWGKKGIGFIGEYDRILALDVDWYYNWGLQRTYPSLKETIKGRIPPLFVPMAWDGAASNHDFHERIQNAIQNDWQNTSTNLTPIAPVAFGFNEPDHDDQADMSVSDGIDRWNIFQQTLNNYSRAINLVSPSCAFPNGDWMKSFMDFEQNNTLSCNSKIQYVGVHYYGTDDFLSFQIAMELYYNLFHLPIVITEFAPADWDAATIDENRYSEKGVLEFAKEALPWLDKTEWIIGYSWFSFERSNPTGWTSSLFYDGNEGNRTQLTPLGAFYKNFTSTVKCNSKKKSK